MILIRSCLNGPPPSFQPSIETFGRQEPHEIPELPSSTSATRQLRKVSAEIVSPVDMMRME